MAPISSDSCTLNQSREPCPNKQASIEGEKKSAEAEAKKAATLKAMEKKVAAILREGDKQADALMKDAAKLTRAAEP